MGNDCCCPKSSDQDVNDLRDGKFASTEAQKSPNRRTKKSGQSTEVNPFKPGARDVRIVTTEDGKLEKTTYKPPKDPEAAQKEGEAQSLVTYSMMNAQKDANKNRQTSDQYGASFQNTELVAKTNEIGQMSFQPEVLGQKTGLTSNKGMAETFGDRPMSPPSNAYGRASADVEGSFNMKAVGVEVQNNQPSQQLQLGAFRNSINDLEMVKEN